MAPDEIEGAEAQGHGAMIEEDVDGDGDANDGSKGAAHDGP